MVKMNTEMKSVQVYRRGAAAERKGSVSLPEGRTRVQIAGMSEYADFDSLKLFFPEKVTGNNIRVIDPAVEYGDEEKPSEKLAERITLIDQEKEVLSEQIRLWKENGTFGGKAKADISNVESYIEKLPERIMTITKKIMDLDREKKALQKDLNKALEEERKPLIEADLYASEAGTYPFAVQYYDNAAYWNPVYEIHTAGKGEDIEFRLRAQITQTTGEDWKNVAVSLYTGNPSVSNSLPEIAPVYLEIRPEFKARTMNSTMMMGMQMAGSAAPMMAMEDSAVEETVSFKRIETPEAEVNDNETMTEYALSEPRDIFTGDEGTIADLQTFRIPAEYQLIAVPKKENHAYLCAEIKTEDLPVMIAGTAGVYLNDAFTGNVSVSPDMTEEKFRISLGRDERVQIQRKELRKKSASALIRNQKTVEHEYEIIVTNRKSEEIKVSVTDQIPVSRDKTIVVETLKTDGGKADETTGLVKWELTLAPQETRSVHLAYRTGWPKDKDLQEVRGASSRYCPQCGARVTGRFCPECGSVCE